MLSRLWWGWVFLLNVPVAAAFAGMTAQQRAEQKERIALTFTVPRLRAAMLDQIAQAVQLIARAMAERVGRRPDDLAMISRRHGQLS
jgi:hypothetical protein